MDFYNTFPRLNKKLNLANIIPKILSKIKNPDSIIQLLIKENTVKNKNSVSFYVKAVKKNENEIMCFSKRSSIIIL